MIEIYIKGKDNKIAIVDGDTVKLISYHGLSNNQCEWKSLLNVMHHVSGLGYTGEINVITDSKLVFNQVNFFYHIKNKSLKDIYFVWNRYKNRLSGVVDIKYLYNKKNVARDYL